MTKQFSNTYEDKSRADAYSQLEFPGTYGLAFRDLPAIIRAHGGGGEALDFGCGAGRSTRFLRNLGFRSVGVDISGQMIQRARQADPGGEYLLVGEGDLAPLQGRQFDVILCAFTFDNIPLNRKPFCLRALIGALKPSGIIVNLVSSSEIYVHEWASFSTVDFPENRNATDGEIVRIVMLDVHDRRPVHDILCTQRAYCELYQRERLSIVQIHKPLGRPDDAIRWVNETRIAPWTIYVLKPENAANPCVGS